MYEKNILVLIPVIAIALLIGAVNFTQTTEKAQLEKVSIRLQWLHQAQFAGFYYADKEGYYREAEVDAQLNPGGINAQAIQLVASNSDQFGVAGADQIILARDKGIPVVAVAVIYRKSPFVLFSLKDSNITSPQQLVGKKVGVKLGSGGETVYRAVLSKAAVDSKKIKEVPIKYDITPLLTKQIDVMSGYVTNEVISMQEQDRGVNLIWPSDYGINFYADTLFTTEKMIKNRPDLVRRVVAATLRGWESALENPEQAVIYTLQYSDKLTREHETKMMTASIPLVKTGQEPIGSMEATTWQSMVDLLLQQGLIKQKLGVDRIFSTAFLR